MKNFFTAGIIICMLFISCAKDSVTDTDITRPDIKVVYPNQIVEIPQGYPLCMKLLISDDKSLAAVWLEVNDGTGFKKEYAIPGRSMEIIEKYNAPAGISGKLSAKFFATDESGNTSSLEIGFVLNN